MSPLNWLQKIAQSNIPPILAGLAAEAKKHATPEEFQKAFLGDIKHGMYWHVTDDPNFFIDPERGPIDMSSMSMNANPDKGKLMVTTNLEEWALNYAPDRPYVALIDLSLVPSNEYKQVNRGFGNEFFIHDPSQAQVIGVFSIKDALRIDYEHHESLPQSFAELKNFWLQAQQIDVAYPSQQDLLSHSEHLTEENWQRQWKEDWASEWQQ